MERKCDISDYRSKLDRTLASPDLTNDETIKTLLKNQIVESSYLQFEGLYFDNWVFWYIALLLMCKVYVWSNIIILVTLLSEYLDNVVERKSKEVSDFLEMLRSATKSSSKDLNRGWKVCCPFSLCQILFICNLSNINSIKKISPLSFFYFHVDIAVGASCYWGFHDKFLTLVFHIRRVRALKD